MWKPRLNYIVLHYAYIIFFALLGFVLIAPYGNMKAIDALFFGASGCTESGLNTIDVKDLKIYQQMVIYFIPIVTNLGFINILVVVVRLYWFDKKLKALPKLREADHDRSEWARSEEDGYISRRDAEVQKPAIPCDTLSLTNPSQSQTEEYDALQQLSPKKDHHVTQKDSTITFAPDTRARGKQDTTLYIPGPRERDLGSEFVEVAQGEDSSDGPSDNALRRLNSARRSLSLARSNRGSSNIEQLPKLSSKATLGRNSSFQNLTERDREILGGTEYLALKLLLKMTTGYFFGLHLFGAACLLPWIMHAHPQYTDYLEQNGQSRVWWAFYSAATMVNNLGFTLTPDSMVSFRDATWPMLVMTFLAFAGNTCYPILLRLVIWTTSKLLPETSAQQRALHFLLEHPRRCYTLLFPSHPTWILFGILVALNTVDTLLIIVLDLDNPEVNALPIGPRILAALFQAASSRHTGTATFNLANVNPAVQFSLLAMMYIAVFPIAISVRASNTYEERSLGIYVEDDAYDENDGRSYLMSHIRNQLSYDLWYIFIGVFCITIAESSKIVDLEEPAFNVFAVLFEVTSAYGNVGLSLGHPDVSTSLVGKMSTFSKVVICAMMIRGRHRMLPSNIDRAIMLPGDRGEIQPKNYNSNKGQFILQRGAFGQRTLKRHHTK